MLRFVFTHEYAVKQKSAVSDRSGVVREVLDGLNGEDGAATAEMIGPELMKRMQEQMRLEDIYNVSIQKAQFVLCSIHSGKVRGFLSWWVWDSLGGSFPITCLPTYRTTD